jgi:hypothetical protein
VLEDQLGHLSDVDFTEQALEEAATAMHDLGYKAVERWSRIAPNQ